MKLIRELRIGPPKSYKTGAVVGTYPGPMLVFLFDPGGLDIIPTSKPTPRNGRITSLITFSDIKEIELKDLITYCKMAPSALPRVTVLDFSKLNKSEMTIEWQAFGVDTAYKAFVDAVNYLVMFGCPWTTYVLDSTTSLFDVMISSIAKNQEKMLSDARKWAPALGSKVLQHISVLNKLQCHCVYIAHSHIDKNEETGSISTLPLGPGYFAERVGGLVSQYIYATTESGEAQVWTSPKGNVKAIGCRWPSDLPQVCSADFKSIYGKEL